MGCGGRDEYGPYDGSSWPQQHDAHTSTSMDIEVLPAVEYSMWQNSSEGIDVLFERNVPLCILGASVNMT